MKILPRMGFAMFVAAVVAGQFWAMDCPFTPGEKLGIAYFCTCASAAAAFEPQAIGTLMAHVEEDNAKDVGRCKEVNPKKIVVHFEKNGGGYEKGSLAEIMPATDCPEVLIDPNYP